MDLKETARSTHSLVWSAGFPASTAPMPMAEENPFDIILLLSLEQILLMEGAVSQSCFDVCEHTPTSSCKVTISIVVQNKKEKPFRQINEIVLSLFFTSFKEANGFANLKSK